MTLEQYSRSATDLIMDEQRALTEQLTPHSSKPDCDAASGGVVKEPLYDSINEHNELER